MHFFGEDARLTSSVELYLLLRAADSLSQPKKGRVVHQLRRILQSRDLIAFPNNRPLVGHVAMQELFVLWLDTRVDKKAC